MDLGVQQFYSKTRNIMDLTKLVICILLPLDIAVIFFLPFLDSFLSPRNRRTANTSANL